MRILLCNPKNSQGTTHSRKGMYPPLGILSIATVLKRKLKDRVDITVLDEDIDDFDSSKIGVFDVIGLYATSFNYDYCVEYATKAKEISCLTVLGGPHATVLSENILRNRECFDYIIKNEAELPFLNIVENRLNNRDGENGAIPNLDFRDGDRVRINSGFYENKLEDLPIPSRDFINFEAYIKNFRKLYPEKSGVRPGSIYSSKGCSWRDKTGGCIFCARLERGVRYRSIRQLWVEIGELKERFGVNSIWDISDDNLSNQKWFSRFVRERPKDLRGISFFIYSRVNYITGDIMNCLKDLGVEEVFLGVESGDNRILKNSFKGQTAMSSLNAAKLLMKNGIKYFPSFVLGLPGESKASLSNTYNLCKEMFELGGIDRLGCTVLQPIPGSPAFQWLLDKSPDLESLKSSDEFDLSFLQKRWVEEFTSVKYETIREFQNKINGLMKGLKVFGSPEDNMS